MPRLASPAVGHAARVDRAEQLARVPLLCGLAQADRASLGERLVERQFQSDQRIFDKGDAGASMFIIASGAVRIFLPPEGPHGQPLELRELGPGEHFGELALLDEKPRSASAEAVTATALLELSREAFRSDLLRSRECVLAVLANMAQRMRDNTTLLSERVARNVVEEIQENLSWSERLADRVARLNGSWAFILGLLGITAVWSIANALLQRPFDAFPYVFFNLILGLMVALQGPLIVMSQNRQAQQDRAQAASDFRVNLKNEIGIEALRRDAVGIETLRDELAELRREIQLRWPEVVPPV